MSFPLAIAKLCINCDFVFAGGNDTCIKCGSKQWVYLQKFIEELKEATEYVDKGELNEKIITINSDGAGD